MKKYILGLFALGFILAPWLSSFAQSNSNPTMVGQRCLAIVNNLHFGSRDYNTNGEVSSLQYFLEGGEFLNNRPTGYFGLLTQSAVKSFQVSNSISPTGYVGPITRAKIKTLTCDVVIPNPNVPTISGISGPQTLNVNETGTWTVSAYDSNGGNLSYSANWGDMLIYNNGVTAPSQYPIQQSATFTHSYSRTGTYTVSFTVKNINGQSASTSLSVNVGGLVSNSPITVLSPNGGETLYKGNNFQINWNDDMSLNCLNGAPCAYLIKYYDIYLNYYYPPCLAGQPCPLMAIAPYTIAKNVYGSSYTWQVGQVAGIGIAYTSVSSGKYTISVCRSGTNICDSSNSAFIIQ